MDNDRNSAKILTVITTVLSGALVILGAAITASGAPEQEVPKKFLVPPPPFSEGIFPCSQCHEGMPVNRSPRKLEGMHQNITLKHMPGGWCFVCHNPNNRDTLRHANGKIVRFEESYNLCGQCHGKYRKAYFGKYPGIWTHGDYIELTENGGIKVYGRSDATLNPGGVRIGTAEIYRIVEEMDEIHDSLAVGKKWNGDEKVILFVLLNEAIELNDLLKEKIKTELRTKATPRHVPAEIFQVKEIPRTISGKKVEIAVSKILNGEEVDNKDALANPHSLDQFYQFRKV